MTRFGYVKLAGILAACIVVAGGSFVIVVRSSTYSDASQSGATIELNNTSANSVQNNTPASDGSSSSEGRDQAADADSDVVDGTQTNPETEQQPLNQTDSGNDTIETSTSNDSSSNPDSSSSGGGNESHDDPETETGGDTEDPPANTPPTAPSSATATFVHPSGVTIRANRATDSDGIARHELLRNGAVVKTSTSSSSLVSINDSTVVSGQSYTYTMRAVDTLGAVGPSSNGVNVTIPPPDTTPPSLPTNFRLIDNSPGSVTFAWDPSTDNQTPQEDIWYILSSPLDESYFYTFTTINPYQTYWFDEPGMYHEVYIQAFDYDNNTTAKVGPLSFTAQ